MFILCLISLRFQQQPTNYDTNAKFKAVFIYNFTRYFEWPDKKKEGIFTVYIVGKNDNLITELKALAAKKKVGNQDMEIKNTATYDAGVNAHIIYLLPEQSKPLSDAASKNKGKGTLIVSETTNGCKTGASINFLIIENKVKFEYSKGNAVKQGLKTNDDFKALAHKNLD